MVGKWCGRQGSATAPPSGKRRGVERFLKTLKDKVIASPSRRPSRSGLGATSALSSGAKLGRGHRRSRTTRTSHRAAARGLQTTGGRGWWWNSCTSVRRRADCLCSLPHPVGSFFWRMCPSPKCNGLMTGWLSRSVVLVQFGHRVIGWSWASGPDTRRGAQTPLNRGLPGELVVGLAVGTSMRRTFCAGCLLY